MVRCVGLYQLAGSRIESINLEVYQRSAFHLLKSFKHLSGNAWFYLNEAYNSKVAGTVWRVRAGGPLKDGWGTAVAPRPRWTNWVDRSKGCNDMAGLGVGGVRRHSPPPGAAPK